MTSLVQLSRYCAHIKNVLNVTLAKTSVPYNRTNLQVSMALYKQGFISGIQRGSTDGPDIEPVEATPDNITSRRLWIDLKYRNNQSVIRDFGLISKPSKKVDLTVEEVKALASGLKVRTIPALQPAECIFIEHEKDVIEIQEAAKMGVSGQALFRVN
ncbi:MRPS8 37S ribosomal protein S8 [Candida maltosa Xu316]|uniref:Likely mitochondrial ribosomal protein S8 n=1 Tax=Candida maltosa (strain Xu316) TaxID=1245528 RepID=M3IVJ2_CANMX|nr:Likely mitochondrial ribosomal protein S8 [Candida maltosa Xu316]